jgi:hypothetical protein
MYRMSYIAFNKLNILIQPFIKIDEDVQLVVPKKPVLVRKLFCRLLYAGYLVGPIKT